MRSRIGSTLRRLGSPRAIAVLTYLAWTYALGFYVIVWGGAGPGDLVPGAFLGWAAWVFGVFFVLVAPIANVILFQGLWSVTRSLLRLLTRRRAGPSARP